MKSDQYCNKCRGGQPEYLRILKILKTTSIAAFFLRTSPSYWAWPLKFVLLNTATVENWEPLIIEDIPMPLGSP